MRFLSRLLALALFAIAPALAQTNYTTSLTLAKLLSAGGPVPFATVCATPADIYGNPITISAPTWGLIAKNSPPMCGNVTNGVLTGGLPVPDAYHTNAPGPIYYNLAIQLTTSSFTPIAGELTVINAVPAVTGASFALDSISPAANVPYPLSNVIGSGSSIPGSCTSPSLFLLQGGGPYAGYCNNGVYASLGFNFRGAWTATTTYNVNDVVTNAGSAYIVTTGFTSGSTFSSTNMSIFASTPPPVATAAYNGSTPYFAGAFVTSGGLTYQALLPSTGQPVTNTTYWSQTADAPGSASTVAAASSPIVPKAMQGLNTYIQFTSNSGTTGVDLSGNGHNAVFTTGGTLAWTGIGIMPNAEIGTIANNAGLPTYGVCGYFPAGGGTAGYFSGYAFYGYPVFGGQQGLGMISSNGNPQGHGFFAYFPDLSRAGGSTLTVAKDGFTGNLCIELVVGINSGVNDRIYTHNGEVTYNAQGSSFVGLGGGQLTQPITLSANMNGTFPNPPIIYSVWNSTTADTPAVAMGRLMAERARLQALGLNFGISAIPLGQTTTNQYAVDGTSIDVGFEASQTPVSLVTFTNPGTVTNFAVSGQASKDMDVAFQDRAAKIYAPRASRNVIYNGGPTNGIGTDGESVADALNDVISWSRKARAQGWKTVASTMLDRGCTGTGQSSTNEVLAQQFNALLIANGDEFDWVANPAAYPYLGASGAYTNTTYFNPDAGCPTHPTNAGQVGYVAALQNGFNGAVGNPLTTVSATYQMLPSDRLIVVPSGTFTITLIDANAANFNTKGKLCVSNQGSGTVTLAGVNSETVKGSSTATVSAGVNTCIIPYVATPSAGGANWIGTLP
jgi:hypothetical protein